MKIIEQSHEILALPGKLLQQIETAGRTCYKSEDKITAESAPKFVERLIKRGHNAIIEFGDITVRFITNRGVTHELVRHRIGMSYAQESTRYVRYDGGMEFIRPIWGSKAMLGGWNSLRAIDNACHLGGNPETKKNMITETESVFLKSLLHSELSYLRLNKDGWRPEQAREVLPNSLKTEIVVKGNIRAWRHLFELRCSKKAHPQMRALMVPLLKELQGLVQVVFDDVVTGK